jgi:FAD/FMN-containing dehydrogenase
MERADLFPSAAFQPTDKPATDEHQLRVQQVAGQLRRHVPGRPLSLRKKTVSHQVPKAGDLRHRDDKIDVGDLDHVLRIDPVRRICVAEPGVTFVKLVEQTLRHGLVPIVVPELKTVTIGGAVSGCAIESMSFRYGGFHDTCLEYEVVTARGEVLTCAPDRDPLLFEMMHGSFGTLGILTRLTFKLVPAMPYVKVTYEHHESLASFQASIRQHTDVQDLDFMDGIIHSPRHLVLCTGNFVAEAPYANRYDWIKVYYRSTAKRTEDYLRTPDYFFRYDHGVTNVWPKSFLGRLLVGKWTHSTRALQAAAKLRRFLHTDKPTITLDTFMPMSRVPELLDWYARDFNYFPLWCVPYRRVRDYAWLDESFYAGMRDDLFLDLAIYGMEQRDGRNLHRVMEEKLRELGGIKTLISHNYYSEQEFWEIFNKRNYDQIKARTDPGNLFRDLYTKTCRAAMGHP